MDDSLVSAAAVMSSHEDNVALLVISGAAIITASLQSKNKKPVVGGQSCTNKSPADVGFKENFEELLNRIGPHNSKQETHLRSPI
ncbi:hypothetical protein PR048_007103 [Dryococelus australis]|uniref:Uncharacterized protein n=1 Tax=Dryococelus australis TaxID=614101 RepID=A0ABQ9ICQ7_9NEOP|nr:hypothetical protein PR048_007103 [Dryococelus australis]